MHYQIPSNIELRHAPSTKGLNEQKVHSLSGMGQWWMECLLEGYLYGHVGGDFKLKDSPFSFKRTDCIKSCNSYIIDQRNFKPVTTAALGKYLRKIIPNLGNSGSSKRTYDFPGLYQLRKDFECEIGNFDWDKGC
jgi:hypothetical protein